MADIPSVIGRYSIVSRLGQGGMGSLYLAKDPKIGRLVAIKLVRAEFDSPEARQRFAREAESAGRLRHPNIVTIFDVDEFGGQPFIAMEYVEGETLSEIVRRKAPHPYSTRLRWIEDLCAGLGYAHRQGIVHRDVKPANLIVDEEGALKILDFGLARREASKFTQTQAIIGTPNYMSPEQIRAGDVGPRSDIFAVGAVLYEVLAQVEAFPGPVHEAMHKILHESPKPLARLVPGLDPSLQAIVTRALEKDPARRYPDLTLMRAEIGRVRQQLEQAADLGPETIAVPPAPTDSAATQLLTGGDAPTPAGRPPSSGAGGAPRGSGSAQRATLEKKRAAQIELHIADARKLCDAGDFEKARLEVERALMFDPDHAAGHQLMEEIAAEEERQRVAALVAAAREALQHGQLERAEEIAGEALALAPGSADARQLRETIGNTKREIERARHIQSMLRRARTRFSEGSFEGTIRACGELLAIDPENEAARELQARAQSAIDERAQRGARDSAAHAAVSRARGLFDKGDKESAIRLLEGFTPQHDLVAAFLASLRQEQVEDTLPGPVPAPQEAVATPIPASFDSASGLAPFDSASGLAQGKQGRPKSNVPVVAGIAAVIVVAAGVYFWPRGDAPFDSASGLAQGRPQQPSAPPFDSGSALAQGGQAPAQGPATTVKPPASLADHPAQTENDRDAMQAYKWLAAGRTTEAAKVIAQIAKRDPRNDNLKDLRAQLQNVEAEKKRLAAAAASPAPAPAPPPAPATQPVSQPATPAANPPAAATGAGAPGAAAAPAREPEPAAPPPPEAPPPSVTERPAIEATIAEYARALSSRDLAAVARVRRYSQEEARSWQSIFSRLKEYRLIAKVTGPPVVTGDRATIPVDEQFAQTDKSGIQVFTNVRKTEYRLEKIGGRWMLLSPGSP